MTRQVTLFCVLIITALICCTSVSAYRYLMIIPTVAPSHYYVGSALAKGLAGAGHQVTVISPFTLSQPKENIEEVKVNGILEAMSDDVAKLLENVKKPLLERITYLNDIGIKTTKAIFDEPNVQTLLKANRTFDAVICEIFLNEAHYGFAEHFKAPLIGYATSGANTWNADLVGTPSPPSYVPHSMLKYTDRMTLMQRIVNLCCLTIEFFIMNFFHLPRQETIYRQYFPHNKQTLEETRRNTALVLLNQHVSHSFPRPYSPNMIEVGGMHLNRNIKTLPADIEKFINDAKHGVIYFSMGSNIKSKNLPVEKREIILNVFRKLKQRVLWKFEISNLDNKPENVFISDWFPQADILAHKNVLAFITHGGLLSTTESIYHGKPLIGIPIFGDQFLNMAHAEQSGYGITVRYEELTEEYFDNALNKIRNNSKYTTRAREMSAYFRDQKEPPRHKGARYMRSASQDLNFMQYHLIDIILIIYGVVFLIIFLLLIITRRIWLSTKFVFGKNMKKLKNESKND